MGNFSREFTPMKKHSTPNFPLSKTLKLLKLTKLEDLLFHFPKKYLDFSQTSLIKDVHTDDVVTIKASIKSIQSRFSFQTKKIIAEAIVSDSTGSLKITWFNQGYIAKSLKQGEEYYFAGTIENYKGLGFINPIHEKVTQDHLHTGRLVPVYKLPDGIYQKSFRGIIQKLLPEAKKIVDVIPESIKKEFSILPITETVKELHFPTSPENLKRAQHRLIFEEVFIQQLAVSVHKQTLAKLKTVKVKPDIEYLQAITKALPFTLTNSQKKAIWQILQDLEKGAPMNRLLQGDVGSGKTAVAFIASLATINAGFQVVLLAPTEILAKQHYESLEKFKLLIGKPGKFLKTGLLTRTFSIRNGEKIPKKELLSKLSAGLVHITIGTHALLQEAVGFKKLGLLIIDEQHRFGVAQRQNLKAKTLEQNKNLSPHLLSLSATPIPRSLALTLFGDLAVTQLSELPQGRQEIVTRVVTEENRLKAYAFIKEHLKIGRQAFVITPLVEESDKSDMKSVKAEFERLQKTIFKEYKLGLLYGSMKGADKDKTMSAFAKKQTDILVATSVIEVGIDIPNATVIAIEGAERFGLAQLHQLRGRVGRGQHKSFCLLFPTTNQVDTSRLELFSQTNSGFTLAEIDLKQRGFGSLFGQKQSGFSFTYSQFLSISILKQGRLAAEKLLKNEKIEHFPLLQDKITPFLSEIHLE